MKSNLKHLFANSQKVLPTVLTRAHLSFHSIYFLLSTNHNRVPTRGIVLFRQHMGSGAGKIAWVCRGKNTRHSYLLCFLKFSVVTQLRSIVVVVWFRPHIIVEVLVWPEQRAEDSYQLFSSCFTRAQVCLINRVSKFFFCCCWWIFRLPSAQSVWPHRKCYLIRRRKEMHCLWSREDTRAEWVSEIG